MVFDLSKSEILVKCYRLYTKRRNVARDYATTVGTIANSFLRAYLRNRNFSVIANQVIYPIAMAWGHATKHNNVCRGSYCKL